MEALRLTSFEPQMSEAREIDFNDFWRVTARRVARGDAEKAWAKAVKQTAPEVIVAAMEEYGAACTEMGTEPRYICHPSTWLNGKRWTDDPAEWWGRDSAKRNTWTRKREALLWWGTLERAEQNVHIESIMALVRIRDEWDAIRQAWERDYAAGKTERFAVEAYKRRGVVAAG